jgi:hypothetical protein
MYQNDDKEKQKAKASDYAKQAMKDAAKRKEKSETYNTSKGIYESTPMKNAAIDYIKGKEMYRESGLKGTEYNK